MLLDINWNRFQDWCAAKFVQLISCAGRQKSLGNTGVEYIYMHNKIKAFLENPSDFCRKINTQSQLMPF